MGIGLAALARGIFLAAFAMTAPAASAATYLYVGNAASNEIVVHALDPKTGDLTVIEKHHRAGHHQGRRLDPDGGQPGQEIPVRRASAASRRSRRASRSMPRPAS